MVAPAYLAPKMIDFALDLEGLPELPDAQRSRAIDAAWRVFNDAFTHPLLCSHWYSRRDAEHATMTERQHRWAALWDAAYWAAMAECGYPEGTVPPIGAELVARYDRDHLRQLLEHANR